jgi:signal transduction protein with GAF and PtsI domain
MSEKDTLKRHLDLLAEISKAITSDWYLDDLLRLIVTMTAVVMNSRIMSLWLLDEKEKSFRLRATQAMDKEYLKERSLKWGEGVVGQVAMKREPMQIYDVLKDPYFKEKEMARKLKLKSMLSVPMCVKDRVVGVLNCYSDGFKTFHKTEIQLLVAVANQAAVAIENTELMVKTKLIQEELEVRKLVEKAKEILFERKGIPPAEAYRRMRKLSMDTRRSIKEIAEAIILSEEI